MNEINAINVITVLWADIQALHRQLGEKIARFALLLDPAGYLKPAPDPVVAGVAANNTDQHPHVAEVATKGSHQPGVAPVAGPAANQHPPVADVALSGRLPATKETDVADVAQAEVNQQRVVAGVASPKPEQSAVAEVAGQTPNPQPSVASVASPTPARIPREQRGIYPRGRSWWAKFQNRYLGTFSTYTAAVAARKVAIESYEKMLKYAYPDPSVEIITVRNYVPTPDAEDVGVATTLPTPSPSDAAQPAIDPEAVAHLKQLQQRFQRPEGGQPRRGVTTRPS